MLVGGPWCVAFSLFLSLSHNGYIVLRSTATKAAVTATKAAAPEPVAPAPRCARPFILPPKLLIPLPPLPRPLALVLPPLPILLIPPLPLPTLLALILPPLPVLLIPLLPLPLLLALVLPSLTVTTLPSPSWRCEKSSSKSFPPSVQMPMRTSKCQWMGLRAPRQVLSIQFFFLSFSF